MVDLIPVFGLLGSITASVIFFPQVWKAWRTKRTEDLSWLMIAIGVANGFFWIVYGFLKSDPFIYVTNTLLFSATIMLAVLKKRYH
ncbi:MAG: hypothetical protein HYT72_01280 [Candidatus Aenigmarchaeota archaeon]|nr:hypothetical protein [Candidatus Aenigmarchaeota archaeon]